MTPFVATTILLSVIVLQAMNANALILSQNQQIVAQYNEIVGKYNTLIEEHNALIDYLFNKRHDVALTPEIHCTIRIWDGSELILGEYHAGEVTNLGDNMTLFWIFGDTDMQVNNIPYTANGTFISIGNQGTLNTSSTVLPGEWNRTLATITAETQSQLNLTCTFYPDASGPYTADCIGVNTNSTASANNLIFYDTFTEVTGIDEDFTITVEFQISVSHS